MIEPTAVLVPVMRRPHNARPFVESLSASTSAATVYAICDLEDELTIAAWREAGATVVVRPGDAGTFAEKANFGYRKTGEPWLFLVGDDVRFHPGWLMNAQGTAGDEFHLIGTNDLANPRVMAGQHATHMLIRRSYVDECGASWDGPGVVCHEGYHHWYVDDELVTAAKQRGVWAMALYSIVEHMHPLFGKGADDEVYRLGQSHASEDSMLFRSRLATHREHVSG